MKSFKLLLVISFLFTCSLNIKITNKSNQFVVTSLNPDCVKSPGEFSNIAPDTKSIVTPKYASKFLMLI